MDLTITEVSLFFEVSKVPKTHVGKVMPLLVQTLSEHVERVVPAEHSAELPEWIFRPRPNSLRFIYSSPLQDIECNYTKSIMAFHGIKHRNIEQFSEHINNILSMLDTDTVGAPMTKYKAVAKMSIRVPWNADALADVITNRPEIAQMIAVCEKVSTLNSRRLFSVVITFAGKSARVAFTCKNSEVYSMISKLPDEEAAGAVVKIIRKLLDIYENSYDSLACIYGKGIASEPLAQLTGETSGIRLLRKKLPELFVNNYTRECPVLPVMISETQAGALRHKQRVIFYPTNSDKGRYYTAPEGHYVGLKRNRLANKEEFPCLVTCYLLDHMDRVGSDTHKYYKGEPLTIPGSTNRQLPKSMIDRGMRKRATSFIGAVESATGVQIKSFPWCPQVARQELWDWSDEDIMAAVKGGCYGSCVYRYFEELVGVSIHVITIRDGKFEPFVPRHKGKYVWAPPYPLHIIVFETYKTTYGVESCTYDFFHYKSHSLLDDNDSVVMSFVSQKGSESIMPSYTPDDAWEQLIDRNGKCTTVSTAADRIATFTRPLAIPVTPEPICFLDSHARKMNEVKQEMGLNPIDLSKRSTNDILYFPNDTSFVQWQTTER